MHVWLLQQHKGASLSHARMWQPDELRQHVVSPLKGLFDQLSGAGVRGGQHALIVSSFADLVPKDLQDSRRRDLIGQLGGVVGDESVR